jgi:DNA-directed RNA polymerase subunit RPC12/RpoP
MSLVKCPNCGFNNDPDQAAGYCDECGRKLPGIYVPVRASSYRAAEPGEVHEVTCPRCGKRTDRVQSFHAPFVIFALLYIAWTHEQVAGCPACVRKRLWRLFYLSIPTANLLFPIIGLMILWDIESSRSTEDCRGIPPQFHAWADLPVYSGTVRDTERGNTRRPLVALLIVVFVIAIVFFVLPRLVG